SEIEDNTIFRPLMVNNLTAARLLTLSAMKVIYHGLATISGNHSKCMMTQLLSETICFIAPTYIEIRTKGAYYSSYG
ncbi:MAG: hypothetical protein ACI3YO_10735, partial [Prevotella sp.]